jgi:hypothetical protein
VLARAKGISVQQLGRDAIDLYFRLEKKIAETQR